MRRSGWSATNLIASAGAYHTILRSRFSGHFLCCRVTRRGMTFLQKASGIRLGITEMALHRLLVSASKLQQLRINLSWEINILGDQNARGMPARL
jgi:hypothetical protein